MYNIQGQEVATPYNIHNQPTETFDISSGTIEIGSVWSGVVWVPIGDSLSDMTLNGTASNPSDYKYQPYIADLLPSINVVNEANGARFAHGGCGYWRGGSNNYLSIASKVPSNATIITIQGSPNDWQYRSIVSEYTNTLSKVNSRSNADKNGRVEWIKNPDLDTAADQTLAGYVADTLRELHRVAPKATIVVVCGWNYCVAGSSNNSYMLNAYFCYQAVAQAMIDKGADWLRLETWYFDARLTKTIDENGDVIYTRASTDHFVEDTKQLDKWFEPNLNGTFDSRKFSEEAFGREYCYDYANDGTSYGHVGNNYHQRYLAVKFAHTLLNVVGGSESDLPPQLRYNNLT